MQIPVYVDVHLHVLSRYLMSYSPGLYFTVTHSVQYGILVYYFTTVSRITSPKPHLAHLPLYLISCPLSPISNVHVHVHVMLHAFRNPVQPLDPNPRPKVPIPGPACCIYSTVCHLTSSGPNWNFGCERLLGLRWCGAGAGLD
jgi:hypothetical protein